MNPTLSKSILAASLLAIGVAVSVPASSQTGSAGTGSTAGQSGTTGQGAASSGGSNAPSKGGMATQGPSAGTSRSTATSGSQSTMAGGASASTALDRSDQKFVTEAVKGGVAEVKLGQLGVAKAQTPEVKQFAQRMVDDHSKANDKLLALAGKKGMQPAQEMDSSAQREYNKLEKLSGTKFDQEYMKHMVSDHKKDIKEFEKAAKKAKDSDVKSFAESTLPTLQDHLSNAQSAQAAAKNAKKTAAKT